MEETIHGTTMPVLELSLADCESIVSEAGEFSWMSDAVQMATNTGGGMGGKGLMGAVKRAVSGASIMMTTYTAQGGAGSIAFASKFPGHILPIDVAPGNEFMVHRHGFMAATPGVELSMGFQQSFKGGIFGDHPSLTDLDRGGNLKFATDFRSVYATVIQRWLGRDPADILDGQFAPLAFV